MLSLCYIRFLVLTCSIILQKSSTAKKSATSKSAPQGKVRINAGVWRSRIIKFPQVEGLRPTPDRVRQTLFNWLGQDLTGKNCLDLFAGTGVMGFEAKSRNAKSVVVVEKSVIAFKALQINKIALSADISLLNTDALQFLAQNHQLFDVVFCDPPYEHQWLDKILPILKNHLTAQALVYVEAEYALTSNAQFNVLRSGKAGAVYYHLIQFA